MQLSFDPFNAYRDWIETPSSAIYILVGAGAMLILSALILSSLGAILKLRILRENDYRNAKALKSGLTSGFSTLLGILIFVISKILYIPASDFITRLFTTDLQATLGVS